MRLFSWDYLIDYNQNEGEDGEEITNSYEYTNYKICLNMMMVVYNKQHLSSIWSWIHEKLSNTEAQLKKRASFITKNVKFEIFLRRNFFVVFDVSLHVTGLKTHSMNKGQGVVGFPITFSHVNAPFWNKLFQYLTFLLAILSILKL